MRVLALLVLISLTACATSGSSEDDIFGRPRVRTVIGAGSSTSGGSRSGSGTITYLEEPVIIRELIQRPADEVWPPLLGAFDDADLAPDQMDPSRRIVSLSRFELSRERKGLPLSTYLDCGLSTLGSPLANSSRVVASIIAQGSEEAVATSQLKIRFEAYALPFEGGGGRAQDCVTTGWLEREIIDFVLRSLQTPEDGLVEAVPASDGETATAAAPPPATPISELSSVSRAGAAGGGVPAASDLLQPGDPVRVTVSRVERLRGTFMGVRRDSLLMRRSRVVSIPLSGVLEVEVKETRRGPVLIGALVGIAAGITVATSTGLGITGDHDVQGKYLNPGLGAVVGGLVGAWLGSSLFGSSWLAVPPESYQLRPLPQANEPGMGPAAWREYPDV
jgi:hypothetical protein